MEYITMCLDSTNI